ncbi:MAG: L-aspartate oxidase [Thiovulaceae bacterium]|nr:L-aspartate oxidase [Sulfurimonadaceae bacterium]
MVYDYLIIGAGVAGLTAANKIPKDKKALIISKKVPWECNTFYAQGGISTAVNEADIPGYIEDTLAAGAGLCNEKNVTIMIKDSLKVIKELIDDGFEFDKDSSGKLLYTKEAAHSHNRILHAGGDATGRYLHQFLLEKNYHPMLSAEVIDLLITDGYCHGVTVAREEGDLKNIYAKNVIIASGGVGALYEYHTNASTISGDIQGIAVEKGLELDAMEMIQFHPTVFIGLDQGARKQLLTEALRGEGATIVNEQGERFVFDVHPLGELASRDIVSRAIFNESQKGTGKVYLDLSNFDAEHFKKRFPNIHHNLQALGYDIPHQRVPISPAFHYSIGGIATDDNGLVMHMKNLYAVGEVASTGVHGANRLASNSLLEGLVFAKRAVEHSKHQSKFVPQSFEIHDTLLVLKSDKAVKTALRQMMWQHVGIVRTKAGLDEVKKFIDLHLAQPIGRYLRLRLLTAKAIVEAALARKKSIGAHYILEEIG